jgi:hypothetical protein
MLNYRKPIELGKKYISGAGLTVALLTVMPLTLMFGLTGSRSQKSEQLSALTCYNKAEKETTLQLETLKKIHGREGASADAIHQILGLPYCKLPKITIRDRAIVDREVYRTAENTRSIVAYEDGQYLGYGLENLSRSGQWLQGNRQPEVREIEVQQTWGIPAGAQIGKYFVASGLGDISLEIDGMTFAPVDGWVEGEFVSISQGNLQRNREDCVIFSSPQMPAYLLKLCGLQRKNLGNIKQGKEIGKTNGYLHISLLSYRKSENGKPVWMYVSPSPQLIESLVVSRHSNS